MCLSESEGFYLNSGSGDWRGKSTVYPSLHEVFLLLSVAYEKIHAILQE